VTIPRRSRPSTSAPSDAKLSQENSGLDDAAEADSIQASIFARVLFWIKRTLLNSQVLDLPQKPERSIAV
jgi:hypothetical protein